MSFPDTVGTVITVLTDTENVRLSVYLSGEEMRPIEARPVYQYTDCVARKQT